MLSLINKRFIKAARNNQLSKSSLKNVLRFAAYCGHLETVKFLVTQGANIHANDGEALKSSVRWGVMMCGKYYQLLFKKKNCWQHLNLPVPAVASVALVAAVGVMSQAERPSITKTKRSKV